jgi:hypothetical protein
MVGPTGSKPPVSSAPPLAARVSMMSPKVNVPAARDSYTQALASVRAPVGQPAVIVQGDVAQWARDLLRHPAIQESAQTPGSLYHRTIEQLAQAPLIVRIPQATLVERLNFTAWARVQTLRTHEYHDDQAVLGDLYLLHEWTHMTHMTYGARDGWRHKMLADETFATLTSEVLIFFDIPTLRAAFPLEGIWADRFLENRIRLHDVLTNQAFYREDPEGFRRAVERIFLDIPHRAHCTLDPHERRSAIYREANHAWCDIWEANAFEVERAMIRFYETVSQDPDAAVESHLAWLASHTVDGVFFPEEASSYIAAYRAIEQRVQADGKTPLSDMPDRLAAEAARLAAQRAQGGVTETKLVDPTIRLLAHGVTSTVYSLPFRESAAVVLGYRARGDYSIYDTPHLRIQDPMHRELIEGHRDWVAPVVSGLETFPRAVPGPGFDHDVQYAANGSSEILQTSLSYHLRTKPEQAGQRRPTLWMFDGDYEGARAYSKGLGIPVQAIPRTDHAIAGMTRDAAQGDFFYLSHPSAIDGNVWTHYDEFMETTAAAQMQVFLDLCYVGAVARDYQIDVTHANIAGIFWSLSKVFGAYYLRIGGGYFKEPNPLLVGNIWFKAVETQLIGAQLMRRFGVQDLPQRYAPLQREAVDQINADMGLEMTPSDVILLGHQAVREGPETIADPITRVLYRGAPPYGGIRACLTPWMMNRAGIEYPQPA